MKKTILFVAILFFVSLVSNAEIMTGNKLLEYLEKFDLVQNGTATTGEAMEWSHATGYVQGVFDAYILEDFSAPDGFTYLQVTDIVKKYLKDHPETRHVLATRLILNALKEAWPKKSPVQLENIGLNIVEEKGKDKK